MSAQELQQNTGFWEAIAESNEVDATPVTRKEMGFSGTLAEAGMSALLKCPTSLQLIQTSKSGNPSASANSLTSQNHLSKWINCSPKGELISLIKSIPSSSSFRSYLLSLF